MVNYQNGKIYTIRCRIDDTLIYVGSTAEERLSARFAKHRKDKKISLYKYIQENCDGNWSNWYIELYKLYPCNSKMELEQQEGEIQRQIATINRNVLGRTDKEYRNDNREKIKETKKEYYQANVEKIREYYQENKNQIKEQKKNIIKKIK
jgi:hypothetical protein